MRLALPAAVLALSAFLAFRSAPCPPAEAGARGRLFQLVKENRTGKPLTLGETGGWRFGRIVLDENGAPIAGGRRFACWAAPRGAGRTLLVSEEGRIYAKDTKGEAPGMWPASDPTAKGWIACGE